MFICLNLLYYPCRDRFFYFLYCVIESFLSPLIYNNLLYISCKILRKLYISDIFY